MKGKIKTIENGANKFSKEFYEENRRVQEELRKKRKKELIKTIFKVVFGIIIFILLSRFILEAGLSFVFTLFIISLLFAVDYYQQNKQKDKKIKQLEMNYIKCLRGFKNKPE